MSGAIIDVTSTLWGTPDWLIKVAENLFQVKFDLDICASHDWAICEKYLTEEDDALNPNTEWNFTNGWCNPPYGRFIPKILTRAIQELIKSDINKTIVFLLPAKTEVKWFHNQIKQFADDAYLLEKRVVFELPEWEKERIKTKMEQEGKTYDPKNSTTGTFGSMLVSFTTNSVTNQKGCKLHFLSI